MGKNILPLIFLRHGCNFSFASSSTHFKLSNLIRFQLTTWCGFPDSLIPFYVLKWGSGQPFSVESHVLVAEIQHIAFTLEWVFLREESASLGKNSNVLFARACQQMNQLKRDKFKIMMQAIFFAICEDETHLHKTYRIQRFIYFSFAWIHHSSSVCIRKSPFVSFCFSIRL